ncbi:MAG TPA: peptide chain release factor N(5)-glutamine methyltransferase [Steroidobacteraceae bacterium]|nr:peptide chain release factor N(5)-glutamine methyltransferase [Steroidobacteraceae bacterium]
MGTADNLADHLLREGAEALRSHSDSAALDAQLLLAHALELSRSQLIAAGSEAVPEHSAARYRSLLRRRQAGEPIAYLTGERDFWSLCLQVGPEVLVPRPETELVVECALALLPARSTAPGGAVQVADLGTGSGAIALALACERPGWQLLATDRSAAALQIARANAQRLSVGNIEFLEGDWCTPLAGRQLDAIVSNPPYVAALDPVMIQLRHEPVDALSPGPRGLEALEAIIRTAGPRLRPGGALVLEHGAGQACAVAAALVAEGFARVRCYRDLAGHDRVTAAHWPGA